LWVSFFKGFRRTAVPTDADWVMCGQEMKTSFGRLISHRHSSGMCPALVALLHRPKRLAWRGNHRELRADFFALWGSSGIPSERKLSSRQGTFSIRWSFLCRTVRGFHQIPNS
jgi:hypothetical protein